MEYACGKVSQDYWACRRASRRAYFGSTWGCTHDWYMGPKGAKKALYKIQTLVLGGVAGCTRITPLVACEVLLGYPPLDLWIRKMAFKATTDSQLKRRINGLGTGQAAGDTGSVTRPRPKKTVLRNTLHGYNIGERSEWAGGLHELTRQGLVWFTDGSKTKRGVGATDLPPFSRLRLGPSRSVPKLCWRETAGENLW